MLIDDFDSLELPKAIKSPTTLLLATSVAGQTALEYVGEKLNKIKNNKHIIILEEKDYIKNLKKVDIGHIILLYLF